MHATCSSMAISCKTGSFDEPCAKLRAATEEGIWSTVVKDRKGIRSARARKPRSAATASWWVVSTGSPSTEKAGPAIQEAHRRALTGAHEPERTVGSWWACSRNVSPHPCGAA